MRVTYIQSREQQHAQFLFFKLVETLQCTKELKNLTHTEFAKIFHQGFIVTKLNLVSMLCQ